jgi:hypothetical protein
MVPGDHHHANPGSVRVADCHRSFWAGWVDDPYRADEDQVMLQILRRLGSLAVGQRSIGHRERTQRVSGKLGHIRKDAVSDLLGQLDDVIFYPGPGAASQQHIRGALGDQHQRVALLMIFLNGGHALAFGGERDLCNPFEPPDAALGDAQLPLSDQKGSLGRVALDLPVTVSLLQLGIASQAPAAEHNKVLCELWATSQLRPLLGDDTAFRCVYPTPVTWAWPEAVITRCTVISDLVSVPVLSEAINEA